MRYY